MSVRKAGKVGKALKSKGFKQSENDHHWYVFSHGGKTTSIRTKISHSHREIYDRNLKNMQRQLKLEKDEFFGVIDCNIGRDELAGLYLKKGLIESPEGNGG